MDFSIATVDGSELHQLRLVAEIPSFARGQKNTSQVTPPEFENHQTAPKRLLGVLHNSDNFSGSSHLNLKRFETYQRPDGVSHTPFFLGCTCHVRAGLETVLVHVDITTFRIHRSLLSVSCACHRSLRN